MNPFTSVGTVILLYVTHRKPCAAYSLNYFICQNFFNDIHLHQISQSFRNLFCVTLVQVLEETGFDMSFFADPDTYLEHNFQDHQVYCVVKSCPAMQNCYMYM